MKNGKLVYAVVVAALMTLIALPAFCEDTKQPPANPPQAIAPTVTPAQGQDTSPAITSPVTTASPDAIPPAPISGESATVKEQSIYGEVQAVNVAANSLTVQYYDYDSDEEKTIELAADKDTKMENAAALGNINKSDWVDVTYVVSNGKNVAKSIMVEKEEKEETAPGAAVTPETKPADAPAEE
jgi:hypothetical protein